MGYFMGLLTNKKLITLSGVSFVTIQIAIAFIMAIFDEGYCINYFPMLNGPTALPTTESTATTMPTSIIPIVSEMPTPPSPAIPMDID